jgi:hypothetical protein
LRTVKSPQPPQAASSLDLEVVFNLIYEMACLG